MSRTLIELVQESTALEQLLYESDGLITEEQTEAIVSSWIAEITSGIALKADGYTFRQDSINDQAKRLKETARRLTATAKALENLSENLKERLKSAMIQMNKTELEGNLYKYKLTSSAPSVIILDESKVPAKYVREKITLDIDKKAIKDTICSGTEVEGCAIERGFTLKTTIKK